VARNYAAEYARRRELERERATREGRPESLHRARGHGSREREQTERRLRRTISENKPRLDANGNVVTRGYQRGERPSTRGIIAKHGIEKVNRNLDLRDEAAKAYAEGRTDAARLLWMRIDKDMPEWLFWYHGVFG
jgi:hypothetical protein